VRPRIRAPAIRTIEKMDTLVLGWFLRYEVKLYFGGISRRKERENGYCKQFRFHFLGCENIHVGLDEITITFSIINIFNPHRNSM
jgi:hypothetical protein